MSDGRTRSIIKRLVHSSIDKPPSAFALVTCFYEMKVERVELIETSILEAHRHSVSIKNEVKYCMCG